MTDTTGRYFASYDTTIEGIAPVTGWFDIQGMSVPPDTSKMIALTDDQWTERLSIGQGVQDGSIVPYTAPPAAGSLVTDANYAMSWVNQQAALAAAMGETFTKDMVAYVKALQAIINGTDTTSTELPAIPADIMS